MPGGNTTLIFALVLHVVGALAILSPTTAAAVTYDMWEEREFEEDPRLGEVPPSTFGAASDPPRALQVARPSVRRAPVPRGTAPRGAPQDG